MTQIVDSESSGNDHKNLIIPTDQIPPAAWQAIYYHLSKKVEINRKLHTGAFEIDKNKIVDLVQRLQQSIVAYGPDAQKVEFTVDFRNDSTQKLSGLEKFLVTDLSHKGSATKRVAIDFDFILAPHTEVQAANNPAQKFKVFIILDQDFFADPDPEQPGFFPDGVAGKNILSIVEYSDYSISRSLQSVVDEWVSTLEKREVPPILKALPRVIRWFNGSIPAFAASLVAIPFIRYADPADVGELANLIFIAAMLMFFSFASIKTFVGWSLGVIAKVQPTTFLLVTTGDHGRKTSIEKANLKRSAIFAFSFVTVVVSFLVGTLSNLFAEFLTS